MLKDAHKVFFRGASLWQRRTSALSTRLIFGTFRVQRRTTAFVQQDGYFGSFVFKDVQDVKYKTDIWKFCVQRRTRREVTRRIFWTFCVQRRTTALLRVYFV